MKMRGRKLNFLQQMRKLLIFLILFLLPHYIIKIGLGIPFSIQLIIFTPVVSTVLE